MDGTLILIKQEYEKDEIVHDIPKETQREILCEYRGITRSEWRDAGQNSINADVMAKTQAVNYEGERLAVVNGKRKEIYRTYTPPDSDEIELYMQDEVGTLCAKR